MKSGENQDQCILSENREYQPSIQNIKTIIYTDYQYGIHMYIYNLLNILQKLAKVLFRLV